jgi:hypothetical protein
MAPQSVMPGWHISALFSSPIYTVYYTVKPCSVFSQGTAENKQ